MKRIGILFFALFLFVFALGNVKAIEGKEVVETTTVLLDTNDKCNHVFGDPNTEGDFAYYLQQIFNVFKYLAPALVIVLSTVEFIKATASDDKDALMKATKKTGIRIVLAILLFFIPGLINFLFDKLGWYGTCGIG